MENKDKPIADGEKNTTSEVKTTDSKNQNANEDAGPSGSNELPGAVVHPKVMQAKPGISKSEHSMRHIITSKDVTEALKSLSFGKPTQTLTNLNLKELKIPILDNDTAATIDGSTTLIDLKKFMASCFKFAKEVPDAIPIVLSEIPNVQSVHPVIKTPDITRPDTNETTCPGNSMVQTEDVPLVSNEVIVTKPMIEAKISKTDKKKNGGNLSEKSDLGITARDSLSSIGSNVCRICMTRGRERLISPCNCKGSLANVHLSCLERWLNQVGRNHCELCGFSYPAIRTPRYTVLQALRLWFGNPRNRSHLQDTDPYIHWNVKADLSAPQSPQSPQSWFSYRFCGYCDTDCLIFWLLSTVTAGLLAVCIVGTQYFVIEGTNFGKLDPSVRKDEGISHRITETAMDFFMAIVLCGYSVTVYLLWKDHYVMWNRWRRANVNVRLLLTPDTIPVPFVPRPRYNVV